jgi:hypothetical protein
VVAERLPDGNTPIGFIGVGTVVEADSQGRRVWQADLLFDPRPMSNYRAVHLPTLYPLP